MSSTTTNGWLKHIAFAAIMIATASSAAAQSNAAAPSNLESTLTPGTTVWVTGASGREDKGRIVGVTREVLTASSADGLREFRLADVARIEARHNDSLLNGALIGAGSAVATGLLLCTAMEPWENCSDDVGPMLKIGAVGAGIGVAIDALFRGRQTIYEARGGSLSLQAAPIVARRGAGLKVTLAF